MKTNRINIVMYPTVLWTSHRSVVSHRRPEVRRCGFTRRAASGHQGCWRRAPASGGWRRPSAEPGASAAGPAAGRAPPWPAPPAPARPPLITPAPPRGNSPMTSEHSAPDTPSECCVTTVMCFCYLIVFCDDLTRYLIMLASRTTRDSYNPLVFKVPVGVVCVRLNFLSLWCTYVAKLL